ncbi:MAG TPA: hypothetical protein VH092_29185 [Urbifossiella sp.]|jgi:protein TonB|nr:hypothetical protein [Urbifossiella sp.]
MNLSRRAKLDREAFARGGTRSAKPAAARPDAVAPIAPEPEPEPEPPVPVAPPAPAPAVEVETPKLPRFVRPVVEKRVAAGTAPLPPRSAKPSGKLMSKNLAAAPQGTGTAGQKGPKVGRVPIANTKKRS